MTISTEDYLKAIFNGYVKTQAIAEKLDVSPAAVTDMLKRLSEKGYLVYERYRGVTLTKSGLEMAKGMVRRHRILELYLNQVLGFPWDKVHEEAEQLEHAASDALINRMEEVLGFPSVDPHGDPIPSQNGKMPKLKSSVLLSECKVGDRCEIVRVSDSDDQFLHYIDSLGLALKKIVLVSSVRSFDKSMVVDVEGKEQSISQFATQHIWIRKEKQVK